MAMLKRTKVCTPINKLLVISFITGLQTSQNAKFYAHSAKFEKFSNRDKTLVVQFTVKHEQKIDCGGGYVKVVTMGVSTQHLLLYI